MKIAPRFLAVFLAIGLGLALLPMLQLHPISESYADSGLPAGVSPVREQTLRKELAKPGQHLLFIYASWCPYCRKQAEILKSLAAEKGLDVFGLSVDKDPLALKKYHDKAGTMPFPAAIYTGETPLADLLAEYKLRHGGSVPFMALFQDGKPLAQYSGFTESAVLEEDISSAAAPARR